MDDEFVYDLEEVMENIDTAEVMSLFFPTFRKALVIDTRRNEEEGAMIRIMPMASTPQERLRTIRRLRPSFPRLRNLTLIPWPRYVDSLVSMGIWDRVVQRIRDADEEKATACEGILEELRTLERAELALVIRGDHYHTIWSAGR